MAATLVCAGLFAATWLFFSNGRVLVVEDSGGCALSTRWMRQLGDADNSGPRGSIELVRPSDGVLVVNASSRMLEVMGSGGLSVLDGPESWMIVPGATSVVPSVDDLGSGGPEDVDEFGRATLSSSSHIHNPGITSPAQRPLSGSRSRSKPLSAPVTTGIDRDIRDREPP